MGESGRMSEPQKRILVVIPCLREDVLPSVESLLNQTLKPKDIVFVCGDKGNYDKLCQDKRFTTLYVKPDRSETMSTNIVGAVNFALEVFSISNYDYVFRSVVDVVLPVDFFERNLPDGKHVRWGDQALFFFRTTDFQRVMGGKFTAVGKEDTYQLMKFRKAGFTPTAWDPPPITMRAWGEGKSYRYFLKAGEDNYIIGYSFLLSIVSALVYSYRLRNPMFLFYIIGHLQAHLTHVEKCDIADYVYEVRGRPSLSRILSRMIKGG